MPDRPAIVLQRPSADTLEAPKPGFTRRFPSAVSPTRPSPRRRRSGTSASSLTSTTENPRWPTGCCSSPAWSQTATCAPSTWTGWTSNASAASPSRPRRCGCRGSRGHRVRAASHRHPRPRRLHLRGVARAGGLRGRGAAGRRRPRDRGADAGQPVPGTRPRSAHHSGAQQDRPARRRSRPLCRRDRPHHRLRARRCPARIGQDGGGRQRIARPRGPRGAGTGRRRQRTHARNDFRLRVRHLPRRGDLRPGDRRQDHAAREGHDDVHRLHP